MLSLQMCAQKRASFTDREEPSRFTNSAFLGLLPILDLPAPLNSKAAVKGIFSSQHDHFVDVLNSNRTWIGFVCQDCYFVLKRKKEVQSATVPWSFGGCFQVCVCLDLERNVDFICGRHRTALETWTTPSPNPVDRVRWETGVHSTINCRPKIHCILPA